MYSIRTHGYVSMAVNGKRCFLQTSTSRGKLAYSNLPKLDPLGANSHVPDRKSIFYLNLSLILIPLQRFKRPVLS